MGKDGSPQDMMKTVVCDAGPIVHLREADLLSALQCCGKIYVPQLVFLEVSAVTDMGDAWPPWIYIERLKDSEMKQADVWVHLGDLHGGESEAFMLAKKIHADWFLTDDVAARLFASSFGLETHGSLGVVLWNAAHAYLNQAEALRALKKLSHSSLWISDKILHEAEQAVMEMCSGR